MKKIVALILVLLSLLLLYGCEKPIASDYVRGYKAKIDNDIPYVYTQGAKTVDGHHLTYGYYEKERPYREFVNEYGNKITMESYRLSIIVSNLANAFSMALTIRFCSARGGRGNIVSATLSELRFVTTPPLATSVN